MLSHFLDRLLDASSNGDLLVDSRAEGGDERAAAEGAGLTAGQWARTRKKWAASRVDVVRGFVQGYSPVDAALKLAVALLVAFSAYLAYCESCKEEHYAMVLALSRALRRRSPGDLVGVSALEAMHALCADHRLWTHE